MILSDHEICHIYANRNRTKPNSTIRALAELNCCSIKEIHLYLDMCSTTYRLDTEIKKPIEDIQAATKLQIDKRFEYPLLNKKGEFTLPWLFYFDSCLDKGLDFDSIVQDVTFRNSMERKTIETEFNRLKVLKHV